MAIKVVSYDLRKPGRDYSDLYAAIKALGSYRHPMDSVWFVATSLSTQDVSDKIKLKIDNNDRLFVHSWPAYYQGWLPESVWDWVNEHK